MDDNTLWKTTLEIWSDFDPTDVEIDTLAHEAMRGDAYCNRTHHERVIPFDGTEVPDGVLSFFMMENE